MKEFSPVRSALLVQPRKIGQRDRRKKLGGVRNGSDPFHLARRALHQDFQKSRTFFLHPGKSAALEHAVPDLHRPRDVLQPVQPRRLHHFRPDRLRLRRQSPLQRGPRGLRIEEQQHPAPEVYAGFRIGQLRVRAKGRELPRSHVQEPFHRLFVVREQEVMLNDRVARLKALGKFCTTIFIVRNLAIGGR